MDCPMCEGWGTVTAEREGDEWAMSCWKCGIQWSDDAEPDDLYEIDEEDMPF